MDICPTFMHDLSTGSSKMVESEEPPSITASSSRVETQHSKDLLADQPPEQIAAEITVLPPGWQASAFHKLPRYQAIAVYQLLDPHIQEQLMEDFQNKDEIDLREELTPSDRRQLFTLLYNPQPIETPKNNDDFSNSPFAVVKQRLGWLFLLLLASTGTTAVIKSQEDFLQHVVVLASFIPLLIAYGGNVSTQTATVVVRALHSQEVKLTTLLGSVLFREVIGGTILGIILGSLVVGEVLLWQNNLVVALVVGLSLFIISVLAAFCGSLLPFFFQIIGSDPALMSAPLSATIVDVLGILIYLYVARLILHI